MLKRGTYFISNDNILKVLGLSENTVINFIPMIDGVNIEVVTGDDVDLPLVKDTHGKVLRRTKINLTTTSLIKEGIHHSIKIQEGKYM